ncbi:MAG TPA: AMP-binding protein, partial [Actinotalea sp.]
MDEFTSKSLIEIEPTENLNVMLARRVADRPDEALIEHKTTTDGPWIPISAREFDAEVVAVAKGLVALGVEPGDRVGIMSRTRYEWTLLDFAAWTAGAVPVPVYETSSSEQVQWILQDSAVSLIVVESRVHAATVEEIRSTVPELTRVLVLDDDAIGELTAAGADVPLEEIERRRVLATTSDVATIIYTSGTTGRPKGAELTHGNFVYLSRNAVARLGEVCPPGSRTLLFMPLAHV